MTWHDDGSNTFFPSFLYFLPSTPLLLSFAHDTHQPKWTDDGHEEQLQINHLSHFLLCSLFITEMAKVRGARMIIVGSITGNSNTIGGGFVLPLADLGDLSGLQEGCTDPTSMVDGKPFNGAKAYKDSKICNMMTVNELHKRYHKSTGITFSSMYPGCIATTSLFREKRGWFRTLFPLFMKYVTGGFVSEEEAGDRLAQVVADDVTRKSGVYVFCSMLFHPSITSYFCLSFHHR